MTHVLADPASFVSDAVAGLLDVHGDLLRGVEGGVARRSESGPKVAVVSGGGSGHYPAFSGYVGPGLCDAAVVGELFASPSTAQILRVCAEIACEQGVVLAFGNYAGDVLNFTAAADRLRADGIEVTVLPVTDDVASASAHERERRRGVAGDVPVLKVLGAAAEAGLGFADVVRLGRRANDRTRSMGVAFSGATMPGQDKPMFSLPAGTMGVGLGIHGEPGISEQPVAPATEIARLLVEQVWSERPADADARVAVVLNGLGATKHEELFVLWRYVAEELRGRGTDVVDPLVGEYVTSLDMAGCSLTVLWLDDELAPLWSAPADTPALQRGAVRSDRPAVDRSARPPATTPGAATGADTGTDTGDANPPEADEAARRLAVRLRDGFAAVAEALAAAEPELGRLDAVAGDGDHGQGMARGSAAADAASRTSVDRGEGAAALLRAAGAAWADRAGGTSGALWGAGLTAAGERLEGSASAAACARAALDAVQSAGRAQSGDKTLVDALEPFVTSLEDGEPWRAAADAASRAAEATAELRPRLGRARPLAEQSLGHPDPGAVSLALVVRTLTEMFEEDA